MKNVLKSILVFGVAALMLVSCKKQEYDYPKNVRLMTLVVVDEGVFFFTGDDGETYFPGDVSRFTYQTEYKDEDDKVVSKSGNRVRVMFNVLDSATPGYDHNIALYAVDDIYSIDVTVAQSAEDVEAAGNDAIIIDDYNIGGGWLDVICSFYVNNSTHELALLDNPLAEMPAATPTPEGYQYLELRQKPDKTFYGGVERAAIVSFRLGEYDPAITGGKGFYVRIKKYDDTVEYIKLDYTAPTESDAALLRIPVDTGILK